MKYLLDVNVLLAWCHPASPHHARLHAWKARLKPSQLATCALSELGFIRVSAQGYGYTVKMAAEALAFIKCDIGQYIAECPPPALAAWAATAAKTTDAYLCQLAVAHKVQLATFDGGIKDPAAFLIA
jgi:predicted nucleic acid-binding protein